MDIQTEITLMEQRLSTMEDKLTEVENKLDSMDKKLSQVIDALIGNKLTQGNGVVSDLKDVKIKVGEHDEQLKKVKWFWLGVLSVGSILAFLIEMVIKLLK